MIDLGEQMNLVHSTEEQITFPTDEKEFHCKGKRRVLNSEMCSSFVLLFGACHGWDTKTLNLSARKMGQMGTEIWQTAVSLGTSIQPSGS